MISTVNLILEKKGDKYDYGCVMLYYSFPELAVIQDSIDPEDLYTGEPGDGRTYGLENEPHTTLLFGLHNGVSLEEVKSILDQFTFSDLLLHNASTFRNPKYDVLKLDVKSEDGNLHSVNKKLKQLPFTSDFPDYHPHNTIGYLKPGTGEKYTTDMKDKEYTVHPTHAVYSEPSGAKHKIKINLAK